MMRMKHLLVLTLMVLKADAECRTNCSCTLDIKGRNVVTCDKGGMVGSIDLYNISTDTEVIRITAPEDNSNSLTMSPVFHGFKKLEEIHITRSNIPQLGMNFFFRLQKLDILNLSQNNITQPLASNFRGLEKLKELHLDDNRILSIPSGTFRYLHELKVLSLQRNRITELMPKIFMEIGKLKVLKLSGNHLKELNPEVFKDVQGLRSLECRGCALRWVDKDIYHLLPHLTHLDLGDNEIKKLDTNEFKDLKLLKSIKLDGNLITAINDNDFTNQNELKKLFLAHNNIETISKNAFRNLHNLSELDLGYNKLEDLDFDLFEPLSDTLEILILSGNNLKLANLRGVIRNLNLTELHLADCNIFDITISVFPDNLAVLNIAGNHLTSLGVEVLPHNLVSLDISRNQFRGLGEDILTKLDALSMLKLHRNPWSCDLCYIVPMLERTNNSEIFYDVLCTAPYTTEGKKLGTLKRKQLTWCTAASYSSSDANFYLLGNDNNIGYILAGTSGILVVFAVLAALGALIYSRRHAAKYYTHEEMLSKDGETIFETHSPLFTEDRELSFKFPMDNGEKKLSISTIDEVKKEHAIQNGT